MADRAKMPNPTFEVHVYRDGKLLAGDVELTDDERLAGAQAAVTSIATSFGLSPRDLAQVVAQFSVHVGYSMAVQKLRGEHPTRTPGGLELPSEGDIERLGAR